MVMWLAMLIAVLLSVAALVVDLGYGRQLRRQTQSAADAAALGAAQNLPTLTSAETQAQSLVATNLPGGTFDWAGCTDSSKFAVSSSSECISYDNSFTQIRVTVPTQEFPTLFGRIMGVDRLRTSASASARIIRAGLGAVQPFALYSGGGAEACLKTGGNTSDPICNNTTGNFGTLDIVQYGNSSIPTVARCGTGAQAERLQNNIAIGTDHFFTAYANPPGPLLDACGTAGPNTLATRTGNVQSTFDLGILHGTNFDDGGPGRLARGSFPKSTVAGVQVDNKPLWEFIPTVTLSEVPTSCQRATFDGLLSTTPAAQRKTTLHTALVTCFNQYNAGTGCSNTPCTGALFSQSSWVEAPYDLYDIQLSPRLVYVPKFAETTPPNGDSTLRIASFEPVFFQRLYVKCSTNSCSADHEPGPWNTVSQGGSNDTADAVTSLVINRNMLPGNVGQPNVYGETLFIQLTG